MQFTFGGVSRRLIFALALGAILVPLAPDTGAVSAKQTGISERVVIAHDLAAR